jgi:glycosyltransferase involved in cell wall biosynthesis
MSSRGTLNPPRRLSGVLITFNEERKVAGALKSLAAVCDDLVVVDSFSTDATPRICRQYTTRFVQREWEGYLGQKQYATDLAEYDWVLSLDADEKLSRGLMREIERWKRRSREVRSGYLIPRMAYFMGRWIRHTTWYPDRQLRLFRRSAGRWAGGRVHERFRVEGEIGRLREHIYHYTYASLAEYLDQLQRFSSLAAEDSRDRGGRVGLWRLALAPPAIFLKNYLLRAGFLEGGAGFLISAMAATSTFFKYAKLWEMRSLEGDSSRWDSVEADPGLE